MTLYQLREFGPKPRERTDHRSHEGNVRAVREKETACPRLGTLRRSEEESYLG
jgi:hypothetical protein